MDKVFDIRCGSLEFASPVAIPGLNFIHWIKKQAKRKKASVSTLATGKVDNSSVSKSRAGTGRLAVAERSSRKRGDSEAFGVEGSNKTLSKPQPDAVAADELDSLSGKHIPKSPHTAGSF